MIDSTRFIYEGWKIIAEVDVALSQHELIHTYAWGLDLSGSIEGAGGVGGLLKWKLHPLNVDHAYTYDANGNVGQLIALSSGGINAHYEYGPFGGLIYEWGIYVEANKFLFSTKFCDRNTNLSYYGYRYYDNDTGRWVNRDPIQENGGPNIYAYVYNNALNLIDPRGLTVINTAAEALEHYWVGDGASATAGSGLISDIQNSSDYESNKEAVEDQIREQLEGVSCSQTSGSINRQGGTIGIYAENNAVGNIDLEYSAYTVEWTASASSGSRTVQGIANRSASFSDEYTFEFDPNDPVTTFFTDVIPGLIANLGAGGYPYTITGSLSDTISVSVDQCCP